MDKKKEIKPDTKTSDVIDRIKESIRLQGGCMDGPTWMEQYRDLPFSKCMDHFIEDPEVDQSWATWYMVRLGQETNLDIRKKFIEKISDLMMAFTLYLRADWLTDEEDKLLEAKFKGKLPTAEAELVKGVVKRKKV